MALPLLLLALPVAAAQTEQINALSALMANREIAVARLANVATDALSSASRCRSVRLAALCVLTMQFSTAASSALTTGDCGHAAGAARHARILPCAMMTRDDSVGCPCSQTRPPRRTSRSREMAARLGRNSVSTKRRKRGSRR